MKAMAEQINNRYLCGFSLLYRVVFELRRISTEITKVRKR